MPQITFMDQITPETPKWLWYPYIPQGKITIIQGDPGEGKSTFALHIAAAVSNGLVLPENRVKEHLGDYVIYQNAEDGYADTILPRLIRSHAERSFIMCINNSEPVSFSGSEIPDLIRKYSVRLFVLDPIQAYLGAGIDMHRANEVRPFMARLSQIAADTDCAIVLIGHMNKGTKNKDIYRSLGSIDIPAAARSILTVSRDAADKSVRIVRQIKNSLAELAEPAAFRLDDTGALEWLGAYTPAPEESPDAERPASVAAKAEALLREWLEKEQPLYARDFYGIAQSEGFTRMAIHRAKNQLGLRTVKTDKGWIWTY